MLPISPSAESAISESAGRRRGGRRWSPRPPASKSRTTIASRSPKIGRTTPVTSSLGVADGVDGVGERQRERAAGP